MRRMSRAATLAGMHIAIVSAVSLLWLGQIYNARNISTEHREGATLNARLERIEGELQAMSIDVIETRELLQQVAANQVANN